MAVPPLVLCFALTLSGSGAVVKLCYALPPTGSRPVLLPRAQHRHTGHARREAATRAPRFFPPNDYTTPGLFRPLRPGPGQVTRPCPFPCGRDQDYGLLRPVTVELPAAGYALTQVAAFPWNRFYLDGEPVPPDRLRVWGRAAPDWEHQPSLAVPVPAGRHRLEHRFEPDRAYRVLGTLSAVLLLLWAAGLVGLAAWGRLPRGARAAPGAGEAAEAPGRAA